MIGSCVLLALSLFHPVVGPAPRSQNPPTALKKSAQASQQNPTNKQKGAKQPSTVGQSKSPAKPTNPNAENIAHSNQQEIVRIVSLPEVTVARDKPTFYVSIILAAIGIAGIIIAIWTVITIKDQTAATKDAAKSAARSVETLVNMERALLVPEGFVRPSELPKILRTPQTERFAIEIKNCGRTPAWITEWRCRTLVSDNENILGLLDYSSPHSHPGRGMPFAPEKTQNFFADLTTNPTEISEIAAGRKHFYVYGFVRYRHVFSDEPHESFFCQHYFQHSEGIGLVQYGWSVEPPEANRYT